MDSAKDYLLVLTACIDPSTGPARVVRSDPFVRLKDYSSALKFWLVNPDPRLRSILFLENSGHSLDVLKELAATHNPFDKRVEFIQLHNNDYPPFVDYGYPELEMLDLGLESSELVKRSGYFIKVTGRLAFPTISSLLNRLPPTYLFAVDCRIPMLPRGKTPAVYASLMIFSVSFYRANLMDIKSRMNDVLSNTETMLYLKLMDYAGRPGAILRWPVQVSPVGYSAHWGTNYGSPLRRAKDAIRQVSRRVLPDLWI
ncbi:MAG TPA: hypothetical protein VJ180_04210 [Pyrinomonadaceae bacterium]|nr:hypothetical protein [Pyrinomonadaceae bacterium]